MADELYRSEIVIDINDRDAIARTERVERRFEESMARMQRMGKALGEARIAPMLNVRDRLTDTLLRTDALVKRLAGETAAPVITAQDEAREVIARVDKAIAALDAGKADVAVNMRGEILKQIDTAEKAVRRISAAKGSPYSELRGPLLQQLEQARAKIQKLDFTQAAPLATLRDRLSQQVTRADSRLKTLNLQTASPILEARDRVSGVLARVDTMVRALNEGKVNVAADMRGPLLEEITRAKAVLKELAGIKVGPVAELRGELFGQLTRAQALVSSLDDMLAAPRATLIDRVSGAVSGISSRLHGLASRSWTVVIRAKDMVTGAIRGIVRAITSPLAMLGIGVGGAAAFTGLVLRPLQAAGAMEQSQIAFETMLGRERGRAFLGELKKFAATTPFEFTGVQESARRLLAFRFEAEEIVPMLTSIGNAAAGLGLGEEGMQRLILALGQMRAKTKVSGEEMRQLTEAGVPAWDMLAKALGKTTAEVMKMAEKGLIPADQAIRILIKGMNEAFPNMMERQSRSLFGLWSTIKDVFNLSIVTRWGDGLSRAVRPRLERLVDLFTKNEDVTNRWGDTLERVAYQVGEALFSKIEAAFNKIDRLLKDPRFQKADLFGKTQILWEEIIVKPFDQWWNSGGQDWVVNMGVKVGKALGEAMLTAVEATLKSNWIVRTALAAWSGAKIGAGIGAFAGPEGMAAGGVIGAAAGVAASAGAGVGNLLFGKKEERPTIVSLTPVNVQPAPLQPPPAAAAQVSPLESVMQQAATVNELWRASVGLPATPNVPAKPYFPDTTLRAAPPPSLWARMRDLVTLHAEGGILTRPHLGLIAEAGPEAVIPLNRSYRAKALALWRTAGERLAAPELNQAAKRPVVQAAYATGTIATRPHVALVAERGPEAIIPLASEFRARAVALWQETGKRLGIPAFARGGLTAPVETSPRWLAPERSEADNAGGIAPSVSTQQTVSTATTINLHLGPVVDRIEIHKESDIDRVVEQVAARFSRELRLALANLAG